MGKDTDTPTPQLTGGTTICGVPKPLAPILCGFAPDHEGAHSWEGTPQLAVGDEELREWYRKHGELGDSLDRNDGTIGAIESKKQFAELQQLITQATERAEVEGALEAISGLGYTAEQSPRFTWHDIQDLKEALRQKLRTLTTLDKEKKT